MQSVRMVACGALMLLSQVAWAEDAAPVEAAPMDTSEVDASMLKDFFGRWDIVDAMGKKHCPVVLKPDVTIGGQEIEVSARCVKLFPVLGEITAWRLMEGWGINLVDAERKTRIRFFTPDDRYIADPETDGIAGIEQHSQ